MGYLRAILLCLSLTVFAGFGSPDAWASVDLHNHLFMKEGMGIALRGDFDGPVRAEDWTVRLKNKVDAKSLEKSGLRIVVAALYAHPYLNLSVRESIHRQIDQAEAFVAENPQWIIARRASEARQALTQGKRVLILSLETAAGILEHEADLQSFVDTRGIRIVTFLHLSPDHFGGVALSARFGIWAAPLEWLAAIFTGHRDEYGFHTNPRSLLPAGRKMLAELVKRKVWIDLAHASDESQKAMRDILGKQPALYTHTTYRPQYGGERGTTEAQLKEVARTGGVVGLIPSEDMMLPWEKAPAGLPSECQYGIGAYAAEWAYVAGIVGSDAVMLGSDFNAPLNGLRPGCVSDPDLKANGFYKMEQVQNLWGALREAKAPVPQDLRRLEERFLQAWSKVAP